MKFRTLFNLTALLTVVLAFSTVPFATAGGDNYSIYGDWVDQALATPAQASQAPHSTTAAVDLSIYGDAILGYLQGSGDLLARASRHCPSDYSIYGAALDPYLNYETVDTPLYIACHSMDR
jgi:hypothetical protein